MPPAQWPRINGSLDFLEQGAVDCSLEDAARFPCMGRFTCQKHPSADLR
ncbi:MAG: hypothetical protein LBT14_06955 [Treponema sp.]|nr:hypothetical protein [Treponema sp.]